MAGIDKFKKEAAPKTPTVFQYEINIDVQCQQCGHWMDKAIVVPDQSVLTWKCTSCGFASVVKGFDFA